MTAEELNEIAKCGETTTVQFKQEFTSQKDIAKDMVAFANTRGGKIFFGIKDKTGDLSGLTYEEIQTISRELGNTANEQVRPTIYIDTEVVKADDKRFLVCTIANGKNKPYKTLTGEIWVKQGADKRRVTENSEILALFQESGGYQPDAASVDNTSFDDLDRKALDDYLRQVYSKPLDGFGVNSEQVLRNIHIMNQDGKPTLAGYLFFGKHPEYNCPTCMVKAVAFYGNELSGTRYRDTKEILGNMPEVYEKCMSFLKANLHNIQQEGASFNTLGKLEIAEDVLEEVVQNALVHRDLLRSAPIRIFIFDNRVEIISPGALAGGLTIEDICNGKTFQRNPFMAVFATNALRYRGIGSGVVRILQENKDVRFENDDSGKEFKVIIRRDYSGVSELPEVIAEQYNDCTINGGYFTINCTKNEGDCTKSEGNCTKSEGNCTVNCTINGESHTVIMPMKTKEVLWLIAKNNNITIKEMTEKLGCAIRTIKYHINFLVANGLIVRRGGNRGGHWEIMARK